MFFPWRDTTGNFLSDGTCDRQKHVGSIALIQYGESLEKHNTQHVDSIMTVRTRWLGPMSLTVHYHHEAIPMLFLDDDGDESAGACWRSTPVGLYIDWHRTWHLSHVRNEGIAMVYIYNVSFWQFLEIPGVKNGGTSPKYSYADYWYHTNSTWHFYIQTYEEATGCRTPSGLWKAGAIISIWNFRLRGLQATNLFCSFLCFAYTRLSWTTSKL